jgi:hypothetical protein
MFEQQYKAAAAEGALYELQMRLLADKVPELQRAAYGKELKDVEALIIARFADALSDGEKTLLERCRQLRNKILHCDFRAARKKLQELGANPQRGDVAMVDIRGLSGQEMAGKIAAALSNVPGSSRYVEDLPKGAGKIYGWLFNASRAGDFSRAVESFARGAAIVDRLAMNSP